MKYITIPLILSFLLLAACGGKTDDQSAKPIEKIDKEAIALGTDIKDVIKKEVKPESPAPKTADAQQLNWEDLVPEDFRSENVAAKYQQEIQDAKEGSKEERELFKKIMGELNDAGPNLALNGKKVRIPGFVSPLDNNGEVVGDFLLVPYFGSCIHSPPPPVNQTVMVSPEEGKSVPLSTISRPVWVVGELEAKEVTTDLATAGYQIKNAEIEPYEQPVN